jgi:drug/metabolite transporter (DMT)-like permease
VPVRDRLLAALVAVLWGGNFLAIDVGLDHFPPLFLAALRFAVIAVPTVLLVPRPQVPLRWLLGYGLGFGTLQFVFLFVAMDTGMPTGLASLVLQASAPFTVLLGAALLRERLGARQAAGIGLAVLGLAAIAIARAQSAAFLPSCSPSAARWGGRWATSRAGSPARPSRCTSRSGCRSCRRCRCWR